MEECIDNVERNQKKNKCDGKRRLYWNWNWNRNQLNRTTFD